MKTSWRTARHFYLPVPTDLLIPLGFPPPGTPWGQDFPEILRGGPAAAQRRLYPRVSSQKQLSSQANPAPAPSRQALCPVVTQRTECGRGPQRRGVQEGVQRKPYARAAPRHVAASSFSSALSSWPPCHAEAPLGGPDEQACQPQRHLHSIYG